MNKDLAFLYNKKSRKISITSLTAYDYPTAKLLDSAGIDIILVGDSVGTNVLGYENEQMVTMSDMIHHLRAVKRGTEDAFLMVDMPFNSAHEPFIAYENAKLLVENGADCVKVEGWAEKKNVIASLNGHGIQVCAHIGYNPQIHGGKASTFGKSTPQALELIDSARILEDAGAVLLVVEKVPEEITAIIADKLKIPVIGIGAGKQCDGQVLVVNDILGFGTKVLKHARRYINYQQLALKAITEYKKDVENGVFPSEENLTHLPSEELSFLLKSIENGLRV